MNEPDSRSGHTEARVTFNVTTQHLKGADKLEFWRDMAGRAVAGCDVSAPSSMDFDITASGIIQHGLSFARIESLAPFEILRDPGRSAHGWDDSILLFFVKSGRMLVHQDGRSRVVNSGDGVTLVADRPSTVKIEAAHATSAIRLPRALMGRAPELASATARTLSDAPGMGRLLFNFANSLCEDVHAMDALLVSRLAQSFTNLLDASYCAMSGAQQKHPRAVSKERALQRIKAFVELHLFDPRLTVDAIAAQFRFSRRYLYKLFELEETSPARYIWDQRLDRAATALGQLSHADVPVKSIAYTHGFSDVAHFSTAFRARFQETPTQYRKRIWRSVGAPIR